MAGPFLTHQQRTAIRVAAKANDLDRYSAALFAPAADHDTLMTLAAVIGDIARIPLTVTEPLLGEIRLQWWREALSSLCTGHQTGNPTADAAIPILTSAPHVADRLHEVINQQSAVLGALALGDIDGLLHAVIGAEAVAFATAAEALGALSSPSAMSIVTSAGQASGAVRTLIDLPAYARKVPAPGFVSDPAQAFAHNAARLARAALGFTRDSLSGADKPLITAVLPLALVEPYLRSLETPGHDVLRTVAEITPLTRLWRLGLAQKRGRV